MKTILYILLMISATNVYANQTKELVGNKKYQKLIKSKQKTDLSKYILEILTQRLPVKYKKDAKLIQKTILVNSRKYNLDPMFVMA